MAQDSDPSPMEVPAEFTERFVRKQLPSDTRRVLEMGCGDGRLAARLQHSGLTVVAIDTEESSIRSSRSRGVNARQIDWLHFEDLPFDAILFTRSLHHIFPLPQAVARAQRLLAPRGVVIVEDFAFDEADDATAEWLTGVLRQARAAGTMKADPDGFVRELLTSDSAGRIWRSHHGGSHPIHSSSELLTSLERNFAISLQEPAAYLFRYVCASLTDGFASYRRAQDVLAQEQRAIADRAVKAIGRRFVAVSRSR